MHLTMKFITSLAAAPLLFFASVEAVAQEAAPPSPPSSGLAQLDPTSLQVNHLWKLGKVWGFLKYHHPLITHGELDWDRRLFEVLPAVLGADSEAEGAAALGAWITAFPAPEPTERVAVGEPHLEPDLAWIHDRELLGDAMCTYLEKVHAGRDGGGQQRYVQQGRGVGNPVFNGEAPYADLKQVDAGYRLLGVYRLWNIIEWWSPYRDQLDDDWDDVLREFIPRFLAAESVDAYGLELLALAAKVKDTHTAIAGPPNGAPPYGPAGLPVVLRFVDGRAIVFRTLETSGGGERLQPGDVLLAIGEQTVDEMVGELAAVYPASNTPARLDRIARNLTRGEEGDVLVRVERDGEELELLTRREPHDHRGAYLLRRRDLPGAAFRLLDDDVAYVKLSSAKVADVAQYMEQAKETKGLVIDIRNYPDEFMILYELGGHLVEEETPFATFTTPSWETPGTSAWSATASLRPKAPFYSGRVVILVDESSISRAEFTAMAYQSAPGAVVVGSTTAGADGNVSSIPLPGNHRSYLSGIGIFYPDRTPTQRTGVAIDVVCVPTIEGVRDGRDELLEEAVRQILGADVTDERVRRISR